MSFEELFRFAARTGLDGPCQALDAIATNGVMDIFQIIMFVMMGFFLAWSISKGFWRWRRGLAEKGEISYGIGYLLVNTSISVAFVGIPHVFQGLWYMLMRFLITPLQNMSAVQGTYVVSAITLAALMYAVWVAGITWFALRLMGYPERPSVKKKRKAAERAKAPTPPDGATSEKTSKQKIADRFSSKRNNKTSKKA